jgi:tetratricopeptide (TPR) repeat protein
MRATSRSARIVGLLAAGLALACQSPTPAGPESVAEVYLEAGRYQDAAREAEQAIRTTPDDPQLRIVGARAHQGLGNTDRAIEHLQMALDLAPEDAEVSILLGEIEQSRENLPDAYVAFRRATKLAPDEIRAWSGLALSAEALGFSEEAADAYERWAELEQEQGFVP